MDTRLLKKNSRSYLMYMCYLKKTQKFCKAIHINIKKEHEQNPNNKCYKRGCNENHLFLALSLPASQLHSPE